MNQFLFLLSILTYILGVISTDDDVSARIFLYKVSASNPVVEGKDFVISYQLYNNGDASALKIEIADRYDINSFEMIENVTEDGSVSFSLDELSPGSHALFQVTIRPKLHGIYESTRARIKYYSGLPGYDDLAEGIRSGSSTSLGRTRILSLADYNKTISYYIKEWIFFIVGYALAIFVPLWYYLKSRSKYISNLKKKV